MKGHLIALTLVTGIASLCHAQTNSLRRSVLTNRDITTLANAGFDEEFLIDFVMNSRRQFDTTPDALAALAKQGITQHIIQAMIGQPMTDPQTGRPVTLPESPTKAVTRAAKPVPAILALEGNTPYFESKSVLWGLWTKRIGVASQQSEESIAPQHLGALYNGTQRHRKTTAVPGQYARGR